jgi:hypothetical protein
MRNSFPSFYRPAQEDLAELWASGLFVLDTNVLLNLYRYPMEARQVLLSVLRQLSPRLWVPHYVALEYQRNRLTVIAEQVRRFDEVRKVADDALRAIKGGFDPLQLKRRHSAIDPDSFVRSIDDAVRQFKAQLEQLEADQLDVYHDDTLRSEVDAILDGRVGTPPSSQDALDEVYAEGITRYQSRIPPGFEDAPKGDQPASDTFQWNGLRFRREYGDLLLWKQILDHAKANAVSRMCLVSDDEKEDWWWSVESRGRKTIGPRPELVEEAFLTAGVRVFYMYNSERFLQFAKTYLGSQVDDTSIDQVREVAHIQRLAKSTLAALPGRDYSEAEAAVAQWVAAEHPQWNTVLNSHGYPDILLYASDTSAPLGYEVKLLRGSPSFAQHVLRNQMYRAFHAVATGMVTQLTIVLVASDQPIASQAAEIIRRQKSALPEGVSVVVGILAPGEDSEGMRPFAFAPI